MSLVTTLPAPISVFEPIFTTGQMTTPPPLHISEPISMGLHEYGYFSPIVLNRNALPITDTELKLMAAAAIIGFSSRFAEIGYRIPAAIGTPRAL